MSAFGGYAISEELFQWIRDNLEEGKTLLELGSGTGTGELVKHYNVYSIEHDIAWLFKYHDNYIHAPLKEHKQVAHYCDGKPIWYDARALERELPKIDYDMILVDGPPKWRSGFMKYWSLFKDDVPVVVDDVNRIRDLKILRGVSVRKKTPFTVYNTWVGGKHFGAVP